MLFPSTEDEVVREWVLAEVDSPRTGFRFDGLDHVLLRAPLEDVKGCAYRRKHLGEQRGWRRNTFMFVNFPTDVSWWHVELDASDTVLTINHQDFLALTDGSRRPSDFVVYKGDDGALVKGSVGMAESVEACVRSLAGGGDLPPCIYASLGTVCGGSVSCTGPMVIIEGHGRAIAQASSTWRLERALLAVSPRMRDWLFY